jgi:CDP-diacylglycerol--serine O-phosphatidyltransferase
MMLKQVLNPPNWFTSASLFCGLYAIILSGEAQGDANLFYKAGLMIFFAGLFDMLDGRVARMTGTGSAFGVQLDSLVDIISFGVAPACLVYFWGLQPYDKVGLVVAGLLMLAGAFRLARFNVQADGKSHKWSQGLTITMGGGTVSSVVMWHAGSGLGAPENPILLVLFVVSVAFLEVSSVPYRTLKSLRLSPKTLAVGVVIGGVCLAVGAVYDISTVLVPLGMAHVLSGPLEGVATWPRRRKARRAEVARAKAEAKRVDKEG